MSGERHLGPAANAGDAGVAAGRMAGYALVADDDAPTRRTLAAVLCADGLNVEATGDGSEALQRALSGRYDLVVLEPLVRGLDGLDGCRRIRSESDVPLLLVSAMNAERDRVLGLEAGADDYVGKPFSVAELLSRVRAILRRREIDRGPARPVQRIGDLEIDRGRHQVLVEDRPVSLTPTEFRLLLFLAGEPGHPFTPEEILQHLWHSEFVGHLGACKAHVSNLRHKIERDPARPRRLVTVRGAGYALWV
jgi:DNA-binding response OmpR family regulator